MTLIPSLTSTPGTPPSYSVGMAETFSWVPIAGADRPLYARATYLTNASDISISLSASDINLNVGDIENLLVTTNTLLDVLTAKDSSSGRTYTLLDALTASNITVAGFSVPPYDEINMEYVGTTNNLQQVDYLNNSTSVLSLSFVYAVDPPTSDDALLKKVKKL